MSNISTATKSVVNAGCDPGNADSSTHVFSESPDGITNNGRKPIVLRLSSPLFTDWSSQYVNLTLAGVTPGTPLALEIDGGPTPFQYTGKTSDAGAEIRVRIGLGRGETKALSFATSDASTTDLSRVSMQLRRGASIGTAGRELLIAEPEALPGGVAGPFAGFAGFPFACAIKCEAPFEGAQLARTNDGPLFTDYHLEYRFADKRHYWLFIRCYKSDPYIEVSEHLALRLNSQLAWTWNPERCFDSVVLRDYFEGENQPAVEPICAHRTRDVLARLQMPVLSEYFIPNNHPWFAFFNSREHSRGMLGVLGLYGACWEEPVENIPEVSEGDGAAVWRASLASGKRHWLLYAGPVETDFTTTRRFVFHRLHAEFNSLRLDEHLDLIGEDIYDSTCWSESGLFIGDDYRAQARVRMSSLSCLQKLLGQSETLPDSGSTPNQPIFQYLATPCHDLAQSIYDGMIRRFERWVRQFQGWRTEEFDYAKNVIGLSRTLRGMLIEYELLRKDGWLTDTQLRALNAYFVFAARRILDEGRWPHDRTWLHPDHPESMRDIYAYGGEHRADRLVWTNSLPNFQSDPLCALAHVSALFRDHPGAGAWKRKATDEIDRQLSAYCGQSGAWEESINYALFTFSYFVITFRLIKYRWGIDYFMDERFRRFAGWLCRYFGPYDKRFDAFTWPGIGNSVHPALGGSFLLAYAAELEVGDPLREDCVAIYQMQADILRADDHFGIVLAVMAPPVDIPATLRTAGSEIMDEVGVSMREKHLQPDESYLFQKIGFAKDHYEGDETSFNWYAKGTPFIMDYGTYTPDVGGFAAHNLVEIPDADTIRRGYLADAMLTPSVDYTRCEVPVSLKLLWGRMRSFAEVDSAATVGRDDTPFYYIGDNNPVGPKCWKVRQLLFVKPDYVVLFDRVYGEVPHRYNLHFTGEELNRQGQMITGRGRFDLDLLAFVQHPSSFLLENGELIPASNRAGNPNEGQKNRQSYVRLYNQRDSIYRTALFAKERGRDVHISSIGQAGMMIVAPEYTDYVFLNSESINESVPGVRFSGRAGWIRRHADGQVEAVGPDCDLISAFGVTIAGSGPWSMDRDGKIRIDGTPRTVRRTTA